MDPITLMLLAQAIPAGIDLIKSGTQAYKANKLAKTPRPQYEIPEAVKQQVNQSRYLASMRELPGQNIMEGRIGESIGKGVSELKNVSSNSADLASNVAKLYANGNNSINDIGIRAGQQWLNNQSLLNNNLGTLGQYQDKAFNINKMQPYENNMAASSALREGAFRNLSAAGQNIASGVGGVANMMYQQNMLDSLIGNNGGATEGFASEVIPSANKGNGNFQIPVKQKTMSESVQTPILSPQTDFEGANSPVSNQKMIDFLLKDMIRNQMVKPN